MTENGLTVEKLVAIRDSMQTVTLGEFHRACAASAEMRDIKDAIILEALDA
jgi:hypothetical protein